MTVDIEIRNTSQPPEGWKSWAEGGADDDIVIQIHYRRLMCTGILNHEVRMAVTVKVSYLRPSCQCGCRCWGWGLTRHYYCAYLAMSSAIVRKRTQVVERVSESRSLATNSRI